MNKETLLLNRIFNYMDDTPEEIHEYLSRANINPKEHIEKMLEFLDKIKNDNNSPVKDISRKNPDTIS